MKNHKQCRNPKEKISKLPKNKWYIEKKDNRALKFKQTMATNLGNTRNTVEPPRCLTAAILEFFFRPQVPASRNTQQCEPGRPGANRRYFSRACVALHTRSPTSASRLPSLTWRRRKNNACFSGYWSRVLRFFDKNTISVSCIKDN